MYTFNLGLVHFESVHIQQTGHATLFSNLRCSGTVTFTQEQPHQTLDHTTTPLHAK